MTMSPFTEPVDEFQRRALVWLEANMPPRPTDLLDGEGDAERTNVRERQMQRLLFAGGFAGICYPEELGGLGLTAAHQRAFNDIADPFDIPYTLNFPTLAVCTPTILELGSDAQKREHIPRVLRGEQYICQFFSEPSGGSDLASARTRAVQDADSYVMNGSKIWSSSAFTSDHAFLLARTDWDAPKHRGLTMFLIPTRHPGIEIRRIRQVDGPGHFCEVFFTDAVLPSSTVIGEVNGGWAVATAQLAHERTAMGGGSPYVSGVRAGRRDGDLVGDIVELARITGQIDDPDVRTLLAEARILDVVQEALATKVSDAINAGELSPTASTILRINHSRTHWRLTDIALSVAGSQGVADDATQHQLSAVGTNFLMRQATSIGGGTTEMARNVLSERLLEMPREAVADRGVPFSQVRSGR
jgi:alkylation response protein AidB-like acyl-CoA dehydrogenase